MFCASSYCREWNPKPLAGLVPCFTCWALGDRSYTLHYVMRGTEERLPCICSHSSWIKSKQGANQRSIITKANIQKALSVSALLRHPLPLQPPSLALVLPPSLHPTPSSSVQLPLTLPLFLPLPQMHFLHFTLFLFFLYPALFFCHPVFTPYSLALALSLLLLHEHLPTTPIHTHCSFYCFFFFFFQPTSYSCVSTSLPPTLLTLSLSQFSQRV